MDDTVDKTLMIQFSMEGLVCYLSQRETLTMWGRCLARVGVNMSFSQGFNPHPKISLPLPRSVGVEGDEELLRVGLSDDADLAEDVPYQLNQQLPQGCRVRKTERFDKKIGCQPVSILYVLSPWPRWWQNGLSQRLAQCRTTIQSTESYVVFRRGPKYKTGRRVDIGAYFQSLEWSDGKIYVRCRFTPEGTVRTEEVLGRLGLERGDLVRPVLRTKIEWRMQ
jgi:radical SAM-linked protein